MREISPYGGIDEFDDGDIAEAAERARDRLVGLVEAARAVLEAEVGAPIELRPARREGRLELHVHGRLRWIAQISHRGRLLLSEQPARVEGHL